MENSAIDKEQLSLLLKEFDNVLRDLNNGTYSTRLNFKTQIEEIQEFQTSFNQILELLELNLDVSLVGENSIINDFIEVFSSFAARNFDRKLEISDNGTLLDAIAAGVNMLGQELEYSTVSKNELELERNRLNQSQEIAKITDWEFYTKDKRIVYSKTFTSLLGLDVNNYFDIISAYRNNLIDESRSTIFATLRKVKQNSYYRFENKIMCDSKVKYLSHIVTHMCDEEGKHVGYKGIVQDITELKEYQNKLKYRTDLEMLVADISSSLIKKTEDFQDTIETSLKLVTDFFDVDRAYFFKFRDQDFTSIIGFEYNNDSVRYDTESIFKESFFLFEHCVEIANSEEVIQISSVESLKDEYKVEKDVLSKYNVKSFICIPSLANEHYHGVFGLDSISEHRCLSVEEIRGLKILANIFSDAVARNIYEKEIIVAREKAEESDKLKSAFLANMSHEIRTPMNGILGFAELLKLPNISPEKQVEFINVIEQSGNRMLNTIDDLVKISRIDSNQIELSIEEFDVVEMLNFTYDLFKLKADKLNLDFKCVPPSDHNNVYIKSDKEKCYAVLSNLVNNALKFTSEGAVVFGLNLDKDSLTFFVEDTGVGIEESKIGSIFERFYQVDLRLNRSYEGSGLGLAISKAYVDMMGGEIWCESVIGKGSSFYFTINTSWNLESELPGTAINIPYKADEYNNLTILVAEDDPISQSYIGCLLEEYIKEVIFANNGREAIEYCKKKNNIDLVLMDIKMPDVDGHDAALEIKKYHPDIPIIAQTAFALKEEREKYGHAFDEYITKPIELDALLMAVSKVRKD